MGVVSQISKLEEILKPLSVEVGKGNCNTPRQEGKEQQSQSVSEMGGKNLWERFLYLRGARKETQNLNMTASLGRAQEVWE